MSGGGKAVWHGGQGHGWMTHFHVVPESGDGIVILTNSQRSWPVMAPILNDWARWSGFSSVKMGRIGYGVTAIRVFLVLVVLIILFMVFRLVRGLLTGILHFAPFSPDGRVMRLVRGLTGAAGMVILAWCSAQPYLLVSSVFPGISGMTGTALFVPGAVMVVSALFSGSEAVGTKRKGENP